MAMGTVTIEGAKEAGEFIATLNAEQVVFTCSFFDGVYTIEMNGGH